MSERPERSTPAAPSGATLGRVPRFLLALGLAGAVVAAAPAATVPNVTGTLTVSRGVYCHLDEPCDPPALDATLVFTRSGHAAVRRHVGSSAAFALRLTPGRYAIRVTPAIGTGKLSPVTVLVPATRHVKLRLELAAS